MYGITKEVRKLALGKIRKQKQFLENNYFQIGRDNIPMSEIVKNAYHNSSRYIAEVNHRVFSLYHYANNRGLKSIFGTITLPSEYHPKIANKMPNPKFINDEHHTPNAGAKELSKMFKKLLDLRILRDIPKEDKCYFRVYEPHKDGTPHLHFSMFVPADKLDEIAKKFKDYFKSKYEKLRVDFQTDINNPVAYLMKYILKTFDDLRAENAKVSDLSLWYIANRITRFYTSRTLISLEIFRKLNGRYNLLELTEMYQNRELCVLLDIDTNKVVSIYDKIGNIYNKKDTSVKEVNSTIKLKYKKKIKEPTLIIDGVEYTNKNGNIKRYEPIIPVNKRTSLDLYTHYQEMNHNIEEYDLKHYGLVKNELIQRDFIEGEVLPLNAYNTDFIYEELL